MGGPPDPQGEETFQRSKLQHELKLQGEHKVLPGYYRELLQVCKKFITSNSTTEVLIYKEKVLLTRMDNDQDFIILFHFDRKENRVTLAWPAGTWRKELDSAGERCGGGGSRILPEIRGNEELQLSLEPRSFALFFETKAG